MESKVVAVYIIKFLYSFVLPPGLFIIIMLLICFRLRRRDRKSAILLLSTAALIYILSTGLVGEALVRSLESRYSPPESLQGDVIVVLGGGATSDTPDIDGLGNLSGSAANRLLAAARMRARTGLPIIFSGGRVFRDSGNEADIARRQLIGLSVPASEIIAENRSLNTEQNAAYVKPILDEKHFRKPILVTSAFHMERAVLEFRQAGMDVIPYPVDYRTSTAAAFYANKLTPLRRRPFRYRSRPEGAAGHRCDQGPLRVRIDRPTAILKLACLFTGRLLR